MTQILFLMQKVCYFSHMHSTILTSDEYSATSSTLLIKSETQSYPTPFPNARRYDTNPYAILSNYDSLEPYSFKLSNFLTPHQLLYPLGKLVDHAPAKSTFGKSA